MSDVTPGKYYIRYLKACEHTAALRACGTKISAKTGKVEEKNFMFLDYQTACTTYIGHENRAAALQRILDAAMDKERINREVRHTRSL